MILQHTMDLQAMTIKYLKEVSLAMKKIALQMQYTQMPDLETKRTILQVEKELLIKTNIKIKSQLDKFTMFYGYVLLLEQFGKEC